MPIADSAVCKTGDVAKGAVVLRTTSIGGKISFAPPDCAIVVVQHIDQHFADNFARWLGEQLEMPVRSAEEGDELVASQADHVLWVPDCPWMLSPVVTVIPLQILAYHIATLRGLDVDQPRNLAKSVTVE